MYELVDRNRDGRMTTAKMRALALLIRKGEKKLDVSKGESTLSSYGYSSSLSSYDSSSWEQKVESCMSVCTAFLTSNPLDS